MSTPDERQAFERILAADPYDTLTRSIYADWLDDRCEDALAAEQRRMAQPAWCDADRWLRAYAGSIYRSMEDVLETAEDYLDRGHIAEHGGLHHIDRSPETSAEFWKHFVAWTGRAIDPEKQAIPYSGCCQFEDDEE